MPGDVMEVQLAPRTKARAPLYNAEQRKRRDETVWTQVQAILAPIQFLVCAISVALVISYLMTGMGYGLATASIILKTLLLYTIMVTGAIWEKVVFGQYLLAPGFFWEDMVSFAVIAVHTGYLWALWSGAEPTTQMYIALFAYGLYVLNAGQFLWKLRVARREGRL